MIKWFPGTEQVAYYDTKTDSIFTCSCTIFVTLESNGRCDSCNDHRQILNRMLYRLQHTSKDDKTDPKSHTNYRYLSTPEKNERLKKLHDQCKVMKQQLNRTQQKLDEALEQRGVVIHEEDLHEELETIVDEQSPFIAESYPEHSFARIFWENQKRALSLANPRSMKWDPLMIRWCLYLRHFSHGAYKMLRETNVIRLPSQRTLQDYTYYTKACTGFSDEIDKQLMEAADFKNYPLNKYVIILMDEIHIKEDVVYDKHTGMQFCVSI